MIQYSFFIHVDVNDVCFIHVDVHIDVGEVLVDIHGGIPVFHVDAHNDGYDR